MTVPMTRPRMADLVRAAARQSGLPVQALYFRTREHRYSHPRQLAMYFCCKAGYSLPQIAQHFNLDHTTVLHARRAVEARLAKQRRRRQLAAVFHVKQTAGGQTHEAR